MKGVSAYLTVGRAALYVARARLLTLLLTVYVYMCRNNPNEATQNKLNQVSQLLDKHFKRLTEMSDTTRRSISRFDYLFADCSVVRCCILFSVIKKNYNVA